MLVRMIRITTRIQNVNYYMATKVRVFWLAAKLAKVSCNDRALVARCPRHIQCVFNLIVDIHVMVNWQRWKRVSADQCHMFVSRAQVYNSLKWLFFLKLCTDQLLLLIDRRLNFLRCYTFRALNGHLLTSSVRSLQGFPCNDLTLG